jgi:hypothetical protein
VSSEEVQSVRDPPGLWSQAPLLIQRQEPLIATAHIEAESELELAQTNRAEVGWGGEVLYEVS